MYLRRTLSTTMVVLVSLIALVGLVRADGTESLGTPSIPIAQGTGIVGAGVGVFGGFGVLVPGDIDVTVPAGATVEQVLLYWAGSHFASSLPDDSTTIKVNGIDVTGSKIGGPTLVLDHRYITYRKDITDMGLVGAGPNTLSISGDPFVDRENDGVGVLVIYDDGTGTSTIDVRDGNDFAYDRSDLSAPINATVPQSFSFPSASADRTADLALLVGDVSAGRANAIEVTVDGPSISQVTTSILAPADPFWPLKASDGALWDTVIASVDIPAGADTLIVEVISLSGTGAQAASLVWVAGALSVPSPEVCGVCKGGVTELTLKYLGSQNDADVVVYNDKNADPNKILFQGTLNPGDSFNFTGPGGGKMNSDISVWVNGVFSAKIHTSCSKPIGAGLVFGDFEVEEVRSVDNGLVCPIFGVCSAEPKASLDIKDKRVKWEIKNTGDTLLFLESFTLDWPTATNGDLKKVKLAGDFYTQQEAGPGPITISSGFEPDPFKRVIKPNDTKILEFEFENDASTDEGDYAIKVVFKGDAGCMIEFTPGSSPPTTVCTTKVKSMTLRYDGPDPLDDIASARVVVTPNNGPEVVFDSVNLVDGVTELSVAATFPETDLGSKTRIRIEDNNNGNVVVGDEIIHTSCSVDFVAGAQAPLDGGTPNPPGSSKGDPSPTWFVKEFTQK